MDNDGVEALCWKGIDPCAQLSSVPAGAGVGYYYYWTLTLNTRNTTGPSRHADSASVYTPSL